MVEVSWFGDALLQQDLVQHQRITTNKIAEEKLLEEDAKASVKQFKRRWTRTLRHDPKHASNSTKDWLKTKKV